MNEKLNGLYYQKQLLDELTKISRALHRLDEINCNYGLTSRQEKRMEKLEEEAEELARQLGFSSYHQGDPRGVSLWLCPADFTWEEKNAKHLGECMPIC